MSGECTDDVCITCSDQLLAITIETIDRERATAVGVADGQRIEVSIELVDGVRAGDTLLCHGGVALQHATEGVPA